MSRETEIAVASDEANRRFRRALFAVFASPLLATVLLFFEIDAEPDGTPTLRAVLVLGLLTIGGAFYGIANAIHCLRRLRAIPAAERPFWTGWPILLPIPIGVLASLWGGYMVLLSQMHFGRGRQLRRLGRLQFAEMSPGDRGWHPAAKASPSILPTPTSRSPLDHAAAAAWRRNGLTEHASVAAFAQLSAELIALGAPPELLREAHEDALDEIRHAELCFTLAAQLDGDSVAPTVFPAARGGQSWPVPRTLGLARLAVNSLIDGALNEGVSARVVAELARTTADPRVRPVLEAIARDEARHAAHAKHIIHWCLDVGGRPVAAAVSGALRRLATAQLGAPLIPDAAAGALEPLGIPGRTRESKAHEQVRDRLVSTFTARVATACASA